MFFLHSNIKKAKKMNLPLLKDKNILLEPHYSKSIMFVRCIESLNLYYINAMVTSDLGV